MRLSDLGTCAPVPSGEIVDRAPPGILSLGDPWIETSKLAESNKTSVYGGRLVQFRGGRVRYGVPGRTSIDGSLLVAEGDLVRLRTAISAQDAGQVTGFFVAIKPVPATIKPAPPRDAWFNGGIVATLSDHSVVFVGDCEQASTDLFARFVRQHGSGSAESLFQGIVAKPNGALAAEFRAFQGYG